jgi:hypothetical protein
MLLLRINVSRMEAFVVSGPENNSTVNSVIVYF